MKQLRATERKSDFGFMLAFLLALALHALIVVGLKHFNPGSGRALATPASAPLQLRFVRVPSENLTVAGPVSPSPSGAISRPAPGQNKTIGKSSPAQPEASKQVAGLPKTTPAQESGALPQQEDYPNLGKSLQNLDHYIASGGGGDGSGDGNSTGTGNDFAGSGAGAFFDAQGYDLGPWGDRVVAIVKSNWSIPPAADLGLRGVVSISFSVNKFTGKLENLQIISSSGIPAFDQAALNSLKISDPFPLLPADFPRPKLGAVFRFFYNTPIPPK